MTRRWLAVLAAVPLIAGGAFLSSTMIEPSAQATGVVPAVPPVRLGDHRMVVAPGLVEPASEEREVAAEMRGRLKRVLVDEGDLVTTGQLIAEIDNGDLQARVAIAEADVKLREGELERLVNGARPEERREAQAQLLEADAALTLARLELERRRPLVEKGYASRETLDQLRSNLASAEAHRSALFERLALVQAPPRTEDVAIAQARLAAAQAARDEMRARLERTYVRAPVDGIVLQRYKRTGEAVADQMPTTIVRIGDISKLRVRADIDETDVARIAVGQRVYVMADAYGSQRFPGTVARVGSRLGRKSVHTDEPTEKLDTKVLQTVVDLDSGTRLPIGLRVDVFVRP